MTVKTFDFVAWLKEQVPPPDESPGSVIALRNHPLLVYARLHKRRESAMPPTDIDPTTEADLAATDDHDVNVDDSNRAIEHADAERFDNAAASPDDPIGGNDRPKTDADTARELIAHEVLNGATALDPEILRIAGVTVGDNRTEHLTKLDDWGHARPLTVEPFDPYKHIGKAEDAMHHARALGKSEREQWAAIVCAVVESLGLAS